MDAPNLYFETGYRMVYNYGTKRSTNKEANPEHVQEDHFDYNISNEEKTKNLNQENIGSKRKYSDSIKDSIDESINLPRKQIYTSKPSKTACPFPDNWTSSEFQKINTFINEPISQGVQIQQNPTQNIPLMNGMQTYPCEIPFLPQQKFQFGIQNINNFGPRFSVFSPLNKNPYDKLSIGPTELPCSYINPIAQPFFPFGPFFPQAPQVQRFQMFSPSGLH